MARQQLEQPMLASNKQLVADQLLFILPFSDHQQSMGGDNAAKHI